MPSTASRLAPDGYQPRSRLGLRYLDDKILLDDEGAYTVVNVPTRTWEMLTTFDKQVAYGRTYTALAGLPRGSAHHARLIITRFPFGADMWADRLNERVRARGMPAPGWGTYIDDLRNQINATQWPLKRVYLIVRLGDRANYDGVWGRLQRNLAKLREPLDIDDEMPALDEVGVWHEAADDVRSTLQRSPLRCQPVGRHEAERLLLQLTHPGLATPDLSVEAPTRYGPGELRSLCGGEVTREPLGAVGKYHYQCLRHETATGTSYQMWFALSLGPEEIQFPRTVWLDQASDLPYEVVSSIGFEVQELSATRKDADSAMRKVQEQYYNDAEAGVSTDLAVHQKRELVTEMKYLVDHHRAPFVRMRALFGVSATDKDELKEISRDFVRHMRENGGFTVDAPPSCQRFFFYESLPTGRAGDTDYIRRVPLNYLAAGMPHLSSSAGDGEGIYRGYTLTSAGQRGEPVFVDHLLYATQKQVAPTEVVVGDPGGGKTVSCGLKPVWEDALRGVTQVIWDPKGDYLVLKAYATDLGLDTNKIICVNVLDGEAGMLDPASQAESAEEIAPLMRETLLRLIPDLLNSSNGGDYSDVVRQAVDAVMREGSTYLMRVVEILEGWEHLSPDPNNVNTERCRLFSGTPARRYRDYAATRLGKLVFGRAAQRFRIPAGYTVIFSTLGLTPPEPGTPPERMQERELLSDVIFGLMADYTWNLLAKLPVQLPKVITWDEWHTSKDNPRAKYLVDRIKRLGRARNTVLRLISQSAGDVDSSFVTGIFAFASRTKSEATKTCLLLGVEPSTENVDMVMQLGVGDKGVCIFRDRDGNIAQVQVEFLYPFVLEYFDTNPEHDLGKMARIIEDIFGAEAAAARRALDEKARQDAEAAEAAATAAVTAAEPPASLRP